MGVIPSSRTQATPSSNAKRRSAQIELPKLGPLKTTGTVGFSTFRDNNADTDRRRKSRKKSIAGSPGAITMEPDTDSDDEDLVTNKMEDIDDKETGPSRGNLSPEEAKFSGELADGVERIHVSHLRYTYSPSTAS